MRKVFIGSFSAIFMFAITNVSVAQQLSFGVGGAIEEWGYPLDYYGLTIPSKGINLGGIVGLSDETYFRLNFGFLGGGWSYTMEEDYTDPDTSYHTKVTSKANLTVFPLEICYLARLPVGKGGSIYPGLGLGLCFGSASYRIEYPDTTIEEPNHSLSGFGIPIVLGIEKAVFGENIKIFGEFQKTLYFSTKETWEDKQTQDSVEVNQECSYSSYLSGTGRIRIGIVYMFGGVSPKYKEVPEKGRRTRTTPKPRRK